MLYKREKMMRNFRVNIKKLSIDDLIEIFKEIKI
jgi:hypothetical protein